MRLLHITHQYPPALGGSERYIADLSEELAARGHIVDVFTSRSLDYRAWRNELTGFERRNGVNVYRYRSMQRRGYVWRVLNWSLENYWRTRSRRWEPFIFFGGGPLCPGMVWDILRRGRQYDLIHLNCLVYGHVGYGYWAARRIGVPVVVTPHAHAEQEVTYNIGYQRAVLAGANMVLADTAAERGLMLSLGLAEDRVSLGGVGLRPENYPAGDTLVARRKLGLPEDKFILLFLGRKDQYKGLQVALRAFAELQEYTPTVYFLAVGPETDDSRALWPQYQALPNLRNMDAVSEEDKVAALQACDCLVLPSVGEAFGIVFLEAWMMGKPVVGARVLSVSSLIDEGQDGLLAEPNDSTDLARCVAELMRDPDLCRSMGRRGMEKVLTRYTVAAITDRVEAAYERVLRANDRTSAKVPSMDDVIEIRDPEINQEEIRQRIRDQVARRLAADGYRPDAITLGPQALRRPPAPVPGAMTSFPGIHQTALDLAAHGALHEPQFASSVPLLGPLIVLLRRAWNWMSTRWYVLPLIWQQTAVNQKTGAVVSELIQWQEINSQRLAELEVRVQELEARLAQYEGK